MAIAAISMEVSTETLMSCESDVAGSCVRLRALEGLLEAKGGDGAADGLLLGANSVEGE
jgi:hypothetical protein